ncbi:MAG: sigma-70 family RNA polymerase sigma factor [Longimicrobiales bacterium]|nr:sigma-70 family RNA polymerase sigma factor [Longimicrobiales bacterium]
MMDASDAAIVARVLSGHHDAFETLVRRYQDSLVAYARYMGFDEATAHDLVQDGFIRAFRHLRKCGDPERFEGWLFKIVSNLCRTAGKKRSKRQMESLQVHQADLVDMEADPEQDAEASVLREQIRAALETLPDDQREALVLMYLQGHSVRDIAEMTQVSVSAVKMRLKRGRDALKGELAPLFFEETR